jgi:hypothetical protein
MSDEITKIKLQVGNRRYPVIQMKSGDRLYFSFSYNPSLMAEIKAFEGAAYHGYKEEGEKKWLISTIGACKVWSIPINPRNMFQLDFLMGGNPYAKYDTPIGAYAKLREDMRDHQVVATAFELARHYCIDAGEMGVGKTLSAIETMESSGHSDWWYVAPRGALKSVERELRVWKCRVKPRMMTYEGLVKEIKNWPAGQKAPRGVFFDESSRIKNPTAKRSQAAKALADGIRSDWGEEGYVILMSGSPAPKAPTDWWHQCEVACPGFLKEGDVDKFKKRLGIWKEAESLQGSKFLQKVAWLDDERRCAICGQFEDHPDHCKPGDLAAMCGGDEHEFKQSVNEVAELYKRMQGLVLVRFKRDCLQLPDKQYRVIDCEPSKSLLRAAQAITARESRAANALILLRELSDGFQYEAIPNGRGKCTLCEGTKRMRETVPKPEYVGMLDSGELWGLSAEMSETDFQAKFFMEQEVDCWRCNATGEEDLFTRVAKEIECPKEQALRDILDEYDDVGRVVVYGGFQASIDRCVRIAKQEGWDIIRVDGRGWYQQRYNESSLEGDPLTLFQDMQEQYPRMAFIGQPGAAGMGLTLTASPIITYYSNDFNAESRIQSEERIHRLGMNINRGAMICDLCHLPTDRLILDNLKKKRQLQAMTLGQLQVALESTDARVF